MAVDVIGLGVGTASSLGMVVGTAVGSDVDGVVARGTSARAAGWPVACTTGWGDGGAIAVALAAP